MPILTNIRHELFAQAIAKGATDVDAYEQAGYKPDVRNAHNLTKNNSVAARIKELIDVGVHNTTVTVERVVDELCGIAFSDIGDAASWGTKEIEVRKRGSAKPIKVEAPFIDIKDSKKLPPHVRRAISEIRPTAHGVSIKMHGKLQSLELLGRYLSMWKEKEEKDESFADLVRQSLDLVAQRRAERAKVVQGVVT